ncbi:MAG: MmcB family DNA repair protein [Alphaproteobacteria bacterium]
MAHGEPGGEPAAELPLADRLARGVSRRLRDIGYGTLVEFRVGAERRVDVIGLDQFGRFAIVEIKTSEADFRGDRKWHEYLPFCDRFYFAVPMEFPREILPVEHGLMTADAFDAAIIRQSQDLTMNAARRRTQILRFALAASGRLHYASDPEASLDRSFWFG